MLGDTSGFQFAYAKDPAKNAGQVTATTLKILPILSESINASRQSANSEAMDGTRQILDTRVVKATNGGGAVAELAYGVMDDFLEGAFQNNWFNDPSIVGHTEDWLVNGSKQMEFIVERLSRNVDDDGKLYNHYERSYGMQVDGISFAFPANKIITATANFMGTTDELLSADASVNPLAGKYTTVTSYTEASAAAKIDSANSLQGLSLKTQADEDFAVVVQDISVAVTNSLRERPQVGSLHSAAPGSGDFSVEIDAKIYFKNLKVKQAFYNDDAMKLTFTVQDPDTPANKYVFHFDRVKVQDHQKNAGGRSQDLVESVKLRALPFDLTVNGDTYKASMAIQRFS